jgi:hypothetical protein
VHDQVSDDDLGPAPRVQTYRTAARTAPARPGVPRCATCGFRLDPLLLEMGLNRHLGCIDGIKPMTRLERLAANKGWTPWPVTPLPSPGSKLRKVYDSAGQFGATLSELAERTGWEARQLAPLVWWLEHTYLLIKLPPAPPGPDRWRQADPTRRTR